MRSPAGHAAISSELGRDYPYDTATTNPLYYQELELGVTQLYLCCVS